jgi:hypothetical protein
MVRRGDVEEMQSCQKKLPTITVTLPNIINMLRGIMTKLRNTMNLGATKRLHTTPMPLMGMHLMHVNMVSTPAVRIRRITAPRFDATIMEAGKRNHASRLSWFSGNQFHRRDQAVGYVLDHVLSFVRGVLTHQDMKPEGRWSTG